MSDVKDLSLEDIISNLNSIREHFDETLRASASDEFNNMNDSGKIDEESSSRALEEYLASRLQQIGEVAPERKEVKGLKTGNGWDASKLVEQVFKIEPISIKRALDIALSSNRTIRQRLSNLVRGNKDEVRIIGTPIVEFIPIWKIKGFHECYYLRTNSYRVNVKDDVVAVEVEDKSRDLILERKHRRLIPSVIVERFQKLGSFLTSESKYFVISDVLELATKRSESELAMTGMGRTLNADEENALTSWRTKRIFDASDLRVRGAKVQVRESAVSKEGLLNKFREQVVRMPERFKQVLSNRLQISEFKRIYVPFIRIPLQTGLVPTEVIVVGSSGDLADEKLLEVLE